MIKLIIFDLDGVLVNSRNLHYIALNKALENYDVRYVISKEEHLARFDGLSTTVKLNMLSKERGLPKEAHNIIWKTKQKMTVCAINETITIDIELQNMMKKLKEDGYVLYCASNSIWNTIKLILLKLGIIGYIDFFISNEEVKQSKPHNEIYLRCIIREGVSPTETLILEDSPIGRKSAYSSGSYVMEVADRFDVEYNNVIQYIKSNIVGGLLNMNEVINDDYKPKWNKPINIIIPMSGFGKRFANANYSFPKPLIPTLDGKPMIQLVVENLGINGNYIFIVNKKHYSEYNMEYLLKLIAPNCKIVLDDMEKKVKRGDPLGAVCSILLAEDLINNDTPLLMANCDQYLDWDSNEFLYCMDGVDGGIQTFTATHPKWSFAKVDDNGFVIEVAEKKPISNIATTGVYYWGKGQDFVKYAEQMMSKNITVNGEFYSCPVFNEAISDGKKIKIHYCKKMTGIGTPEDLEHFLNNYK